MSTPQKVLDLVEVFDRNADAYESAHFKEAELRQQFVNPLFACLGWDMDNEQGYAEAYKDVVHEAALKIGGATKAPDYSFRIGGAPKFYLEAKKPAVNVKDDPSPAFQLRRYAWSAKMPLSILTNFKEFAVYDCRVKPAQTDKASAARILYLRCDEFASAWDEKIAGVFSRDAVLKGSFDKFADAKKAKRGTAAVDAAFLDEIEKWREQLARNLALRNPDLSSRELNFAVQVTIDRIIFLRMCEDRGVESYGQLLALQNGAAVYGRLKELFQKADDRYNSGLFHFHKEKDRAEAPDELTPQLHIDDLVLKSIFRGLYYPDSPYEFSVLPVEILGHVYEQFLGKVIRLTAAHQAKVEEKPEVKKAGGVYYTPSYIVDYIVQNTVGRLLEGKTPKEAARLTVLDPACGSGSFLVGAYRRLLEWHLKQYEEDGPEKHTKEVFQAAGGAWRLTTAEKKRILLNNIYGVDIDPQAVEVTKLSLLLVVLEGESQETIETQRKRYNERALPDLAGNIKCGNSLIGPDFYEGEQAALLDEEERYRINVFDWNAAFPKVMKAGGFDAVIGNPPYIRMEAFKELKSYLSALYSTHDARTDMYVYFLERGQGILRDGGRFGMIVSNKFIRANYGEKLRRYLIKTAHIDEVVDLAGLPVFRGATVRTVVLTSTKAPGQEPTKYAPPPDMDGFRAVETGQKTLGEVAASVAYNLPLDALSPTGWRLSRPQHAQLLARLRTQTRPLVDIVNGKICRGIVSGLTEAFVISIEQRDRILARNPDADVIIRPFLQGRDIRKYYIEPRGEYLIYTHHGIDMRPYPAVMEHLLPFKRRLEQRRLGKRGMSYNSLSLLTSAFLRNPRSSSRISQPHAASL